MSRIRRGSFVVSGSSVQELLHPSENVVKVCRRGESIPRVADSKRLLRVLIVDDNRDAADCLSMLVNLWGDDARAAYDGAAALEMALGQQPDVVLLDLSMPKMDGCQVARRLRQQTVFADTLLIAVTGWTDQAHRFLCDEAGFDHYLVKPIDLVHLEILLLREGRRLAWSDEESTQTKATSGLVDEFREEVPVLEGR
jgi:two-component system, chemotaxis family, CheB/CheR fusion protein